MSAARLLASLVLGACSARAPASERDNGHGQLGDGTTERRYAPVQVSWPS